MLSRSSTRQGDGKVSKALSVTSLHKTEQYVEHEIEKENRTPPSTSIGKVRFYGQKMMHTKQALLCIVILNVLDCLMVLGELIIDIYYVKGIMFMSYICENVLQIISSVISDEKWIFVDSELCGVIDKEELGASIFMEQMKAQYPDDLHELSNTNIGALFNSILRGHVIFAGEADHRVPYILLNETKHMITNDSYNHTISKRSLNVNIDSATNMTSYDTQLIEGFQLEHNNRWEIALAHKLHYTSITILAILVVENFLKLICNGKEFFEKKLEVFDAFVVLASFVVDLYFVKGVHDYEIQKFLFILSFLIPWRIIRVVNSLIVAVRDHEDFRLKLLYKQKKEIATELKNSKSDVKCLRNCVQSLKEMGISAGIPENVIEEKIAELTAAVKRKKKISATEMISQYFFNGRTSKQQQDNEVNGLDRQESAVNEHAKLLRINDYNNRN